MNCDSKSNDFWLILKSANDDENSNDPNSTPVSQETWINHFENLHSDITNVNGEHERLIQNLEEQEKEMKAKFNSLDQSTL